MSLSDVKKGDEVLLVYCSTRMPPRSAVVESAGPKWIVADGSSFARSTGLGDYGWTLYASREAYDEKVRLDAAWGRLVTLIGRGVRVPPLVSIDQIERAYAALGGGGE